MGAETTRLMADCEDSGDMTGHDVPQPDLAGMANRQDCQCFGLQSLGSERDGARADMRSIEVKERFCFGGVEACPGGRAPACAGQDRYGLNDVLDRAPKQPDLIQVHEPLRRMLRFSRVGGGTIIDCQPMRTCERETSLLTRRASGLLGRSLLIRRKNGEARGVNC